MAGQLRLVDSEGNEKVRLGASAIVIGRDGSCDLVLKAPDVALVHARLAPLEDGRLRLTDLAGSAVTVNGATVSLASVGEGDTIGIAGTLFRIEQAPSLISAAFSGSRSKSPAVAVGDESARAGPNRSLDAASVGTGSSNRPIDPMQGVRPPSGALPKPAPTGLRPGLVAGALALGIALIAVAWIATLPPSTPPTPTQRLRQTADRARVLEAEASFGQLLTQVEEKGVNDVVRTVEAWAAAFGDVVDESEIPDRVGRLEFADRRATEAFLRSIKPRIEALLELKAFEDAGKAVANALTSPLARGDVRTTLETLGRRAEFGLGSAIEGLKLPDLGSRPAPASQPSPLESRPGEGASQPVVPALTAPELLEQAIAAVGRTDFEEAETKFNLAAAFGGAFEELRTKALRCKAAQSAKLAVIQRLKLRRPVKITMDDGASGNLIEANSTQVSIEIAAGAQVVLPWDRLPSSGVASMARTIELQSKELPNLASWLLLIGENETALVLLTRYCSADALRLVEAGPLIAEARGVPFPPGGFTLVDGKFKSAEEKVAKAEAERFVLLRRRMVNAGPTGWQTVADEMRALLPDSRSELDAALKERALALRPKFESALGLTPRAKEGTRAKLYVELEDRRKVALALIEDSTRYPYPYLPASEQEKVQGRVNDLVQFVRDLWETPATKAFGASAAKLAVTAEWRELLGVALAVGTTIPSPEDVLREWDPKLALRSYVGDTGAKELLDHAAEVAAYNASMSKVISKEERDCHNAVNMYRVMMGRRAVMIDDRLVMAARGHSNEMVALKYFAHDSPVKEHRSPSDRARLAGWGGAVSENIAFGMQSGDEAVRGWIQSSGHHRNILGAGHTHLGCGCNTEGWTWTQNFGRGSTRPKR